MNASLCNRCQQKHITSITLKDTKGSRSSNYSFLHSSLDSPRLMWLKDDTATIQKALDGWSFSTDEDRQCPPSVISLDLKVPAWPLQFDTSLTVNCQALSTVRFSSSVELFRVKNIGSGLDLVGYTRPGNALPLLFRSPFGIRHSAHTTYHIV